MSFNELKLECSGCRRKSKIVVAARGMRFCFDCKDKAPSHNQFKTYLRPTERESRVNWKSFRTVDGRIV